MTEAFVGDIGSGKTLNMVKKLIEIMKTGRKVITNTPISFDYKGKTFKSITIFNSDDFLKVFINSRYVTIGLDEAGIFFPATFWNKVSGEIIYKLAQTRHMGVDLLYTVQGFSHTIKRLRDLTHYVVSCKRRKFWLPFPHIGRYKDYDNKKDDFLTHRYPTLKRPVYYAATMFRPDFFRHSILDKKKIRQFIITNWNIYPSEARRLFVNYNTTFLVQGSALVKMNDIDRNFNVEDLGSQITLQESLAEDPRLAFDKKLAAETAEY
jgi:hypothetical protein